ncbi:MAG TPA: glycyl-radical enzyme activating protein [Candidatus Ornithomonoglobus intestinigallinarum]|uniref:Glycyl-radical enzyme activating protein n=1 Tax=Candidatus Ornithomonoglobus intestinigallinarum TaxID=2840894 RepID=A0A9D1H3A7_9FIRM|nr:glycyl-radical enzyme activating protein [Candidatus Ornithomonoglobus intestinigallinarum]
MEKNFYNTVGRIFDIQKYSIHDGPGIRTIVFLKGCALRCRWCCNPESQSFEIEHMLFEGKDKVMGEDVTVADVMDVVRQDSFYYMRSGGGLTLSGGESLLQPEFAVDLLRASHDMGINTAMETTAIAKWDIIEKFLPHLDYMLLDIKHMNSEKHKAFTTQPNERILENAVKIAESGMTNLTIRVPVIPTFNHTPEEIRDIASFAASLKGVTRLHLLPYHRLGQGKYDGLGREYLMRHIEPMTNEYVNSLLEAAKRAAPGLHVQIGG